jgi:hypothetical protein
MISMQLMMFISIKDDYKRLTFPRLQCTLKPFSIKGIRISSKEVMF